METKHVAELQSIRTSNKIASDERVTEARRDWEREQKNKVNEQENERRVERKRLLETVKRVEETRRRLEAELNEEEARKEEEEKKKSEEEKQRVEGEDRERREREQLEENLGRFRMGMKITLENIEREKREREEEEIRRERTRASEEEETERRIAELTDWLKMEKATKEALERELETLKSVKTGDEKRQKERLVSSFPGCGIGMEEGIIKTNKTIDIVENVKNTRVSLVDERANIENVLSKSSNELAQADIEESRRIIAGEVMRKLVDKVEILESLQSSSSQQVRRGTVNEAVVVMIKLMSWRW